MPDTIRRGSYTIRRGEKSDAQAFCDLHSEIFSSWPQSKALEIFKWKYIENPFISAPPVIVAERNGRLVGARGYFVQDMMLDGRLVKGLQSCDLMVHPDHRRKGLFLAMNELGRSLYDEQDRLYFSFPKPAPRRGYRKRGWCEVKNTEYVRIASGATLPSRKLEVLRWSYEVGKFIADLGGKLSLKSGEVRFHRVPPIETLVRLYENGKKEGWHARRSLAYYRWRFRDPLQKYVTYTAVVGGEMIGAVNISYSKQSRTLFVRDIVPFNLKNKVLGEMLNAIVRNENYMQIRAWACRKTNKTFIKKGFLNKKYIPYFEHKNQYIIAKYLQSNGKNNTVNINSPHKWSLQMIERDC